MAKSKKSRDAKSSGHSKSTSDDKKNLQTTDVSKEEDIKSSSNPTTTAATLETFSKRANELKADISETLTRQADLEILKENDSRNNEQIEQLEKTLLEFNGQGQLTEINDNIGKQENELTNIEINTDEQKQQQVDQEKTLKVGDENNNVKPISLSTSDNTQVPIETTTVINSEQVGRTADKVDPLFEPLTAKLDPDSKCSLLLASIKRFICDNEQLKGFSFEPKLINTLLEPLCRKLVELSDLLANNEIDFKLEQNRRLKLENLCRELQKSNNSIRLESLELIQVEQKRSKEQGSKIQETLSGVMKLFNENQARNVAICKENRDLQTKLISILEHCGNWEKSVETALKEKDLTIKLAKTQVAKSELLRHEEKESWLVQKRDYLQIINLLQAKQTILEEQSEKLRKDLQVNMEKYEIFHKQVGEKTNKFQRESKVLFDRMEKSSKEHKTMVNSYEHLLNENKKWVQVNELSAKKIDALEKLCRTLRNQNNGDDKNSLKNNGCVDKQ